MELLQELADDVERLRLGVVEMRTEVRDMTAVMEDWVRFRREAAGRLRETQPTPT